MTTTPKIKTRKTAWQHIGSGLALALTWFGILFGIGACNFLTNRDAKAPLVVIHAGK